MSSTLINSSASKLGALDGLKTAKRVFRGIWSQTLGIHAVLIYGAPGSGKSTLAEILAQAWLCQNPGPEGACGECRPCQAYENGNAIDLHRISPEGPSAWIRKKAIRPVDEPNAPLSIQEFLRTLPLSAKNKVVIIEDADRIYYDAFNSLLKILEEPPPYGRFILTTNELSLVRTTIRSRCMCVNTELPQTQAPESQSLWEKFLNVSPGEALEIAKYADIYKRLIEFAEALPTMPAGAELRAAEELRSISEEYAAKTDTAARSAQARMVESLARALSLSGAPPEAIQTVLEAHRRILGNANAGIVFDSLLIELASILTECS